MGARGSGLSDAPPCATLQTKQRTCPMEWCTMRCVLVSDTALCWKVGPGGCTRTACGPPHALLAASPPWSKPAAPRHHSDAPQQDTVSLAKQRAQCALTGAARMPRKGHSCLRNGARAPKHQKAAGDPQTGKSGGPHLPPCGWHHACCRIHRRSGGSCSPGRHPCGVQPRELAAEQEQAATGGADAVASMHANLQTTSVTHAHTMFGLMLAQWLHALAHMCVVNRHPHQAHRPTVHIIQVLPPPPHHPTGRETKRATRPRRTRTRMTRAATTRI